MAGLNYTIRINDAGLAQLTSSITGRVLPLVAQSVRAVAQATTADWQASVLKAKLWSGEKDAYAASIKWASTSDFSAVISSDYKHADEIETGRPAYDLKKMLDTSMKVRLTKGGKRFLVIPFRHNTPGNEAHAKAMPAGVYAMAKAMAPSTVVKTTQRQAGEVTMLSPTSGMHPAAKQREYLTGLSDKKAAMVAKRHYAWGDRLTGGMLKAAGLSKQEARNLKGMVKMDTSTPGGAKSSAYITFRIMMEGQKGWIIPPRPGLFIARDVAQRMQPKALEAFQAAVKKTMGGV